MRGILWLVLALAASIGPAALARRPDIQTSLAVQLFGLESTKIVFTDHVIDFGTVFQGETVVREFEFENTSEGRVRILEVDGTCGCLAAVPSARWLESGARGVVRAKLILDGRYGPQDLRIRIRTDESEYSGTLLTLRGNARVVVRPDPKRLFLGELAPGSRHERRIGLEMLEPTEDPRIECRGAGIRAELGADRVLEVDIEVPRSVGPRFHGILLTSRHRETGRDVETWIPVVWTVPPPLAVEPAEALLVDGRAELTVRARWPEIATPARTGRFRSALSCAFAWLPPNSDPSRCPSSSRDAELWTWAGRFGSSRSSWRPV
jgi:hypothetical protein